MAITYMPVIRPDIYGAFRAILENMIPNTYEEWRDLMTDRIHQISVNGDRPHGIDVDAHEFASWLPTRWDQRTANGLFGFAAFKAVNGK